MRDTVLRAILATIVAANLAAPIAWRLGRRPMDPVAVDGALILLAAAAAAAAFALGFPTFAACILTALYTAAKTRRYARDQVDARTRRMLESALATAPERKDDEGGVSS